MLIRQLTPDDAADYLRLRLRALREHPDAFRSSFEEESARTVEWAVLRLDGAHGLFLGAFNGDMMIGTVGLELETRAKLRHQAKVIGMYVTSESAHQGVGRALVDACVDRARAIDTLESLILTVTSSNEHAVRMYRHAGFSVYGREPSTMKIGTRYFDKTMMVLNLRGRRFEASRVFDISPAVGESFPVYPGDAPFAPRWATRIGPDQPFNLSALSLSPHTGAHADAPLHYDDAGASIGEVALDAYLGLCRVVHAFDAARIEPRHIAHALDSVPPRVLVRSYRQRPTTWDEKFAALTPDAMELLAARHVKLIGIDTPSIDPAGSRTAASHRVARDRGVALLEGLALDDVPEGDYELIALPLKWKGLEASPVRAVLRAL